MARPTRQQRRERRAERAEPVLAGGPPAAPPRRPTARGGSSGAAQPHSEPHRESRGGIPGVRFVRESWGELKKVEWPGQHQVITGTTVVLIACIIVGAYLYANDIVWKHVVQNFLVK